jgi:CRISPR-associated protein Cas1
LYHRSPYNTFPLADDLMEPFRPAIDRVVHSITRDDSALSSVNKKKLLEALTARYLAEDESRTLLDWIMKSARSLAAVVLGESEKILLPCWMPGTINAGQQAAM